MEQKLSTKDFGPKPVGRIVALLFILYVSEHMHRQYVEDPFERVVILKFYDFLKLVTYGPRKDIIYISFCQYVQTFKYFLAVTAQGNFIPNFLIEEVTIRLIVNS